MEKVLTGSCQCGKKKFEAKLEINDAYYCHCRMCQKAFGNIFATYTNLNADNVKWINEEPDYYSSSTVAKRGFCSHCGTPMSFKYNDSTYMDLAVGCFDTPDYFELTSHRNYQNKVHWLKDDDLPKSYSGEREENPRKWNEIHGENSNTLNI